MKYIILSAAVLMALSGCVKEPLNNMTEEESRIYITNHDSTASFSSYKSFSIADSVAVVTNNKLEKKALADADKAFIDAVKLRLQSNGYTLVSKEAKPDLGVSVSRVYNTYTGIMNYPDYWGGYPGYWDPYYWGYGGYGYYFPVYYGVYQISKGAYSVDVLDLKNVGSDKKIKGIWNGLVRGTGVFRADNAPSQVKALFDQSTYFKSAL